MPLLKWNDELSVGINSIDEQHKKLVDMINALNDAIMDGKSDELMTKIFDELTTYTVKHFGYEEQLFMQHGYMESESHKREHEALINQVKSLQVKMNEGNFMISVEVMAFLKDWLKNHIMKTDKTYAPFLIDKGVT